MLELENIRHGFNGRRVLHDASCRFEAGKIMALVGPNGAGKTSLMRVAAGLLEPERGRVSLDGIDFSDPKARARALAYLPQFQNIAWPLLCRDVVALGLLPLGLQDSGQVAHALETCGAAQFAARPIDTLSGGEAARVHLARLMVGDAPVLLLDEPVQSLDAAGAEAVMQLLRQAAQRGKAVGLVVHDLNLAQHYCDHVVLMDKGRIVAQGAPSQLFTPATLKPIFGVEFTQIAANGADYILPQRH